MTKEPAGVKKAESDGEIFTFYEISSKVTQRKAKVMILGKEQIN